MQLRQKPSSTKPTQRNAMTTDSLLEASSRKGKLLKTQNIDQRQKTENDSETLEQRKKRLKRVAVKDRRIHTHRHG